MLAVCFCWGISRSLTKSRFKLSTVTYLNGELLIDYTAILDFSHLPARNPGFLRSLYSHVWPFLVHQPHLGTPLSHLTFRDLHSSQETLNGLDVFCLFRLPDPSSSASERSSSPLHTSSSLCSAALPGESSLFGVLWVLVDIIAPKQRGNGRFGVFVLALQPRSMCAKWVLGSGWTPSLPRTEDAPCSWYTDGLPHDRTCSWAVDGDPPDG